MKQSSFIVGALLAAFVLFIAARGRLPLYASVVWGPKPERSSGGSSGSPLGGGFGDVLAHPPIPGADAGGGGTWGVPLMIPGIPFPIPIPIPDLGDMFG